MAKKITKKVSRSAYTDSLPTVVDLVIGGKTYSFAANIFELDESSIGVLGGQASRIPADMAYCGTALAAAEKELKKMETMFDIWEAERISKYSDEKTETAKKSRFKNEFKTDYIAKSDAIIEAGSTVRVLKAYRDALDAKLQLAQTLSANIRHEKDAIERSRSNMGARGK